MDLEHENRLTAVEERAKSNTHQIAEIKQRQENLDSLITSVAELAGEQKHIKDDVGEIKLDLREMKDKPAKRWDGLVDKLIFGVAGAVIAWVASGAPM